MANKMILGTIIEIIVIVLFLFLSIPLWQAFDKKISTANVTTLNDYNVNFDIYSIQNLDMIIVTNKYYINKNYKINLVVNKSIDEINSSIFINDKKYLLSDFYIKKEKNNNIYTLVDDYINGDITIYEIRNDLKNINNYYTYIFEEKTVF